MKDLKPAVRYSGFTWSYHPLYAPPGPELPLEWFKQLEGVGKPPWVTYKTQAEAFSALVEAWDRLPPEEQAELSEYREEVERIRSKLQEQKPS